MMPFGQVIAPNLIIYRIARGISFTSEDEDITRGTDIRFATRKQTKDESHTQVDAVYSKHAGAENKQTNSSLVKEENTMQLV